MMIFIIVAVVVFGIVLAGGLALAGGRSSQEKAVKRAQAIVGAGARDSARRRGQAANTAESRRKQIMQSLQDQEKKKRARVNLRNRLLQAGLRFSVLQFWIGSAAFGVCAVLIFIVLHLHPLLALGLGVVAAFGLPLWVLGFLAKRRTNKFTATFSDAMDVIVRGIKSGLPVHDCLKIIGRETAEPLSGEFRRLVENIGMGVSLDQALDKLFERMPTPEVRFFSIVMNIQQKTGGNLAEALNNLSAVLRSRKLMREKVKALSAEATSSAMIIGALPPGVITMIMITQPSYMSPMFTDHRGWLMLGVSGLWMSLGIFVMVKMINFKF
jgi:tight adherence protein B